MLQAAAAVHPRDTRAIFTKIAHFDENRTKDVRFSQKYAIFTKMCDFHDNSLIS